jgi:2-polyprenyl-6-hydroxyphenyl methylase/3-demethylubiquinone-9 3-methyltransferase
MKTRRGPSLTDKSLSFEATEFVWDSGELSETNRLVAEPIIRILRRNNAKTVLDLGCANGALSAEFSSAGFDVTACDASKSGIHTARENYSGISFFHHDVSNPLGDAYLGRYDAIVSIEVIEHLLLPRLLLHRAVEALRPGGVLVLTTPFHGYWKNLALALAGRFDEHWHPLRDFGHVKFFSKRTIEALLREQGLGVRCIVAVGRVPVLARTMIVEAVKVS